MKSKIKRSLLSIFLLVFLCTGLTACTTKSTNTYNVDVTFDNRTITVSCPEDNTFVLNVEIETNSTKTSWTSENLQIAGGSTHNYDLESLVGNYVSESAKITAVNVQDTIVTDYLFNTFLSVFIAFFIGFIFGVAAFS